MRRRRLRWITVGAVVIVGLLLVVDVVAVQYLESRGAAQLARSMSAEDAKVDLGGFPFLIRFMRGKLTDVSVVVNGASAAGGLRVQSISARMPEVDFSPREIFSLARSSFSTRTKVTAVDPFVSFELGEQDLEDFVRRVVPLVGDLRVKATGIEIRFLLPNLVPSDPKQPGDDFMTKPARYLPVVENGRVVLRLISVSQILPMYRLDAARLEHVIDLPQLPAGLRPNVSLREKVIVFEAQGPRASITVGEGDPPT